ncbi:MAG: 4'-phosphopantetheinyl transferase superfamily protein [Terriglobales bacterium]
MQLDSVPSQHGLKGPDKLALLTSHVDVWRLRLDDPAVGETRHAISESKGVLSLDELNRAARFHFERDCARFVRCRAALRGLLARYLDIAPADIRFSYNASGKPEVAPDQNPGRLRFNVSHSENTALIAVGPVDDLGVDIEKVRVEVNTADLAERFFSARERKALRELPQPLRLLAFYACWTRKEAFLKAMGDGLGFPLSDFSVSVHPDVEPRVEEIQGDAEAGREWSLIDLSAVNTGRLETPESAISETGIDGTDVAARGLPATESYRSALAIKRGVVAVRSCSLF